MSIKLATNSLSHKATNSYESTGQRDVVFWFYFVFFWGGSIFMNTWVFIMWNIKNCHTFLSPWVVTDQFLGNSILIFICYGISLMALLYELEQLIFQELPKSQVLKGRVQI